MRLSAEASLRPKKDAFETDLTWEEAIHLGRRLDAEARRLGRRFGVKMTNTLVVENHKRYFDAPLRSSAHRWP